MSEMPTDPGTWVADDRSRSPPVAAPFQSGQTVGRYVLLAELGRGGMGVVWSAYDPELDRKIAIKLLRGHGDAEGRRRLLREAQHTARLVHPNVVTVHDVGVSSDHVYVAMEFVDGRTLRRWFESVEPSVRQLTEVMLLAGRGLSAAHRAGLVHRDFKSDNVMVASDERVLVMDFGLARERPGTDEAASDRTGPVDPDSRENADAAGTVAGIAGTPAYMAPEQFRGEADARSDQFAYCVTFWELLHGERPYDGETLPEIVHATTLGNRRTRPRSRRAASWLLHALERGFAHDPANRYESMEALLADLIAGQGQLRRSLVAGLSIFAFVGILFSFVGWKMAAGAREGACSQAGLVIMHELDERMVPLRQALEPSDLPFARDTLNAITPELHEFADEWATTRDELCREHTIAGTLDADTHDRALECLDDLRFRMLRLTEGVAQGRADAIEAAVKATHDLTPPLRCRDPVRLARMLPPGEARHTEIRRLEHDIAAAETLLELADLETPVRGLEEARDSARLLGHARLVALAELRLGQVAVARGRFEPAREHLRSAWFTGVAAGADELALDAATRLVVLHAQDLGQLEIAGEWERHALALVERIDLDDPIFEGRIAARRARLAHLRGDPEGAMALLRGALEDLQWVVGGRHPLVAELFNELAIVLNEMGDGEALDVTKRAIEIETALVGEHHPVLIQPLTNHAGALFWAGRVDDALEVQRRSIAIAEARWGENAPQNVHQLTNLATFLDNSDRAREAAAVHGRVVAILDAHGLRNSALIAALAGLASAHGSLGEYEAAERALARMEVLLADYPPDHLEVLFASYRKARLLHVQGRHPEALELYLHAHEGARRSVGPSHPITVHAAYEAAVCEVALGRPDAAAARLPELSRAWPVEAPSHGRILVLEGRIALARGQLELARPTLEAAVRTLEENRAPAVQRAEAESLLAGIFARSTEPESRERASELVRAARERLGELLPPLQAQLAETASALE